MARHLTLIIAFMIFASSSYAGRITPEELQLFRGECLAAQASATHDSLVNQNAIKACLTACPEALNLTDNRRTALCVGRYNLFKQAIATKFAAPIARVNARVDYSQGIGWKILSADNTQVAKQCKWVGLAAARTYPDSLKGYQMMIAKVNEVPVSAVAVDAILINLRIESDKAQYQTCTAEVIYLRCPPHQAEFAYCHP